MQAIYRDSNGDKIYLSSQDIQKYEFILYAQKPGTNNPFTINGVVTTELKEQVRGGVVKFVIPKSCTNRAGVVKCELHVSKAEERIASTRFIFNVEKSLVTTFDEQLLDDEDFPILQQLILDIQKPSNIHDGTISYATTYSSNKIETIKDVLNLQINEKANKNEVFSKNQGININDFDEETRRTFLQQQGISVNYVLGNNAVRYPNLSPGTPPLFLAGVKLYENLLGASLFTEGSLYQDGTVNTANTNYYVSHYIGINPGKTYYRWNKDRTVVVAYYDADKTFIDRPTISSGTSSFVAPSNAYYMRYTDAKEQMMNEIISSIPITKHHNYVGSIYEFDNHYALSDNSIGADKLKNNMLPTFLKSKSITRDLLPDYVLGAPDFLADGVDLNTIGKDGYFVCTNCANKPDGMGTCFLLNRVFLNDDGNPRWAMQEIFDFNDISKRFIRIVDLQRPTNNKAWINLSRSKSKFAGKKLITVGDSITEGVGASNSNTTYPGYLKNKYGLNVVNTGIAGATWANYNDGYDDISIIHQVDNTDFSGADFVTIFAGTNDFGRTNGDTIGNTTDTVKNTVKGAMNYVIGKILAQNPNIKMAIITPMWRQRFVAGDNKDSDTNTLGGQYLIDYVKAIEEQAKYNHIPCLNLYETCLINKHNYSTYLSDGLHPNDKGYELLADKIHSFLESVY